MTCIYRSVLVLILVSGHLASKAQTEELFMLSLDNDLFAAQGQDGAYTSGVRLNYIREHERRVGGLMVVEDFGLQQIMITPNDISDVRQEPGDYPYAGLLSISYSRGIVNPHRNRSITTELMLGILGPYSFAGEIQTELHRFLGSNMPQGWDSQYGTSVLANVNCTMEVGLPRLPRGLEVVMQSKLFLGTILTGASLQGMIKFGNTSPHFNSVVRRYFSSSKSFRCYGVVSQQVQGVGSNTLLTDRRCRSSEEGDERTRISHVVLYSSYGINFAYSHWGLALEYKTHSGLIQGQPIKAYGGIAISFSL